jgi:hypothetical protein
MQSVKARVALTHPETGVVTRRPLRRKTAGKAPPGKRVQCDYGPSIDCCRTFVFCRLHRPVWVC